MLDFRLRVFYTVAKLLNFTKAAATLQISQPAVTKHIKELEQSYNVTLFHRQPNALSLTDAGKILYKHATTIMAQYDLLDFDISILDNKITGSLRIAASSITARYILSPILAAFNQYMPDIHIHLMEGSSSQVQQMVVDNTIDVGFVETEAGNLNLQYIPYLEDEIVLSCGLKNSILHRNSLSIYDLQKLQFVGYGDDPGIQDIVSRQLKNAGISSEILKANIHLSSIEGLKSFLINSLTHFAFIPYRVLKNGAGLSGLRIIGIDNLDSIYTVQMVLQNQQLSPTLASFVQFVKLSSDNV